MFAPSALRRLTLGMPRMVIAVLVLSRWLLSPLAGIGDSAHADPNDAVFAGLTVICHAGGPISPAGKAPSHDHACMFCTACSLVAQASLPAPAPPAMLGTIGGMIGQAIAPSAAIGPPHQPRLAAHPTGPPLARV